MEEDKIETCFIKKEIILLVSDPSVNYRAGFFLIP